MARPKSRARKTVNGGDPMEQFRRLQQMGPWLRDGQQQMGPQIEHGIGSGIDPFSSRVHRDQQSRGQRRDASPTYAVLSPHLPWPRSSVRISSPTLPSSKRRRVLPAKSLALGDSSASSRTNRACLRQPLFRQFQFSVTWYRERAQPDSPTPAISSRRTDSQDGCEIQFEATLGPLVDAYGQVIGKLIPSESQTGIVLRCEASLSPAQLLVQLRRS